MTFGNNSGYHRKFDVTKIQDVGGKHVECTYFVIDLKHDKLAGPVLQYYAGLAQSDGQEELADDLLAMPVVQAVPEYRRQLAPADVTALQFWQLLQVISGEEYLCPGDGVTRGPRDCKVTMDWEHDSEEDGGGSWPVFEGSCEHVEMLNDGGRHDVGSYFHTWVIGQRVERLRLRAILGLDPDSARKPVSRYYRIRRQ